MTVPRHKFRIGNPCGPCEYHIERAVKVLAWFDLVFQAIFVVPTILQFKFHLCIALGTCGKHHEGNTEAQHVEGEAECYENLNDYGLAYTILDIVNLTLGISTDLLLYFSCVQEQRLKLKFVGAWLYFAVTFVREILHICGLILHMKRCSSETYPYEIATRLLCQYLIYGIWIVWEYIGWLHKGRQFVPKRGLLEPPGESVQVDEKFTLSSLTSGKFTSSHFEVVETNQEVDPQRLENIKASIRKSRARKSQIMNSDPTFQKVREKATLAQAASSPPPTSKPAPASPSSPPPASKPAPPSPATTAPPPASGGSPTAADPQTNKANNPRKASSPGPGPGPNKPSSKASGKKSKSGATSKNAPASPGSSEENHDDEPLLEQWTRHNKKK